MDTSLHKYSTKSTAIQVVASVLASTGMFVSGMVLGFPSAMLGSLVDSSSSFYVTVDEASWVSSVAAISSPVGCLLGGPLVDFLGRRWGLQLLNIPIILGFGLLALVPRVLQSLWPLVLGRMLTGFGAGLAHCAAATYTAEVVTSRLRTKMVSIPPVMMGAGIFVVYLMADLFQDQWFTAACIGLGVGMFSALFTFLLPESPLWLLSRKNCPEKALQSLMKMRGTADCHLVDEEFSQIKLNALSRNIATTHSGSWKNTLHNMGKPEAFKPLIIMNVYFLLQQTTGITIIIAYGVEFAKEAEISEDAYTVALSIGVLRVLSTFITTWMCGRWGRRGPAIYTCTGVTLSLLVLTVYLGLRHAYPDTVSSIVWLPTACFLINILTTSIGFSTMPWSMLGEIFPTKVRGVCSGLTSCLAYFISFLALKFYPIVEPVVGNIAVFGFFGVSALVGTIFIAIFLPETHGKSLQEIEDHFKGKKTEKSNLNSLS